MPAGRYRLTGTRIAMASLIQSVSLVAYVSWGFYLWVNVKHYGSQPECNHQIKYVIFFFTVRVTANWLRRLSIAFLAIACPVILFNVFGTLATIIFAIMNRTNEEEEEEVEETDSLSYAGDYFRVDTSRLLCVAPRFSFNEHRDSRITIQFRNILHGHARAYGEWAYLSYLLTLY